MSHGRPNAAAAAANAVADLKDDFSLDQFLGLDNAPPSAVGLFSTASRPIVEVEKKVEDPTLRTAALMDDYVKPAVERMQKGNVDVTRGDFCRLGLALGTSLDVGIRQNAFEVLYKETSKADAHEQAFKGMAMAQPFLLMEQRIALFNRFFYILVHNSGLINDEVVRGASAVLLAQFQNATTNEQRRIFLTALRDGCRRNSDARGTVINNILFPLIREFSPDEVNLILPIIEQAVIGDDEHAAICADRFLSQLQHLNRVRPADLMRHNLPVQPMQQLANKIVLEDKLALAVSNHAAQLPRAQAFECLNELTDAKNADQVARHFIDFLRLRDRGLFSPHACQMLAQVYEHANVANQADIKNLLAQAFANSPQQAKLAMLNLIKTIMGHMSDNERADFVRDLVLRINPLPTREAKLLLPTESTSDAMQDAEMISSLLAHHVCCSRVNQARANMLFKVLHGDSDVLPREVATIPMGYVARL